MNIVFWLIIIFAGIFLWYSLSGWFNCIGKEAKEIKDNIFIDEEENENE